MLGYVICEKSELKVKVLEWYKGYYCGICKSIGKRYGQLPRMALSYDAAFLALLQAGLKQEEDRASREHCITHPVKKRTIIRNQAIDYAADTMLLLAWYHLLDDKEDEGKKGAKILIPFTKNIYQKIAKNRPELNQLIADNLEELRRLEKEKCPHLDQVAEPFAKIMEGIFTLNQSYAPGEKRLLKRMGYHLGKWIYLIDAIDDLEKDDRLGSYNPLFYRYEYNRDKESVVGFKKRITGECEKNTLTYLEELGKTFELLTMKKNRGIIDNVVYLGLLRKTENVLGGNKENGKSL